MMKIRIFDNERELQQRIVDCCDTLPPEIKSAPDDDVFAWSCEHIIEDGGRRGGLGRADILTVDEGGQVWLLEVKIHGNPELDSGIWERQLRPYRDGLKAM
jgi:hypothetical protein